MYLWHILSIILIHVTSLLTSNSLLVERLSLVLSSLEVTKAPVSGQLTSNTKVSVQRSDRV